jgi:hypothetical protein
MVQRTHILAAVLALTGCEASIVAFGDRSPNTRPNAPGAPSGPGSTPGENPTPIGSSGQGGQPSASGQGGASASGTGGAGMVTNPCGSQPQPDVAPLRRLAHDEYRFTLLDLFSNAQAQAAVNTAVAAFGGDPVSLGFRNGATFLEIKGVQGQSYFDAAEAIAGRAAADLPGLGVCTTPSEATCASDFIRRFGKRAYRRPLTTAEVTAYTSMYTAARMRGDTFATAIEGLVLGFLLSPHMLYRVEPNETGAPPVRPLNGFELASRLSYAFWRSGPDQALLDAAEQGRLGTPAEVEAQARRLLADAKASRLTQFFEEWLDIDEVATMRRNGTTFPNLNAQLGPLLVTEAQELIKSVMRGDGKLSTLLTADYTFANQALAQHYGLSGVTGTAFTRVSLANRQRRGLLMSGGVIANHDKEIRTSIVNRGVKIRTQMLCQVVPAAPNNIPALGAISQNQTQADRLAQHRADPACAGCHVLMDPLGVPFEGIDAVGRERTQDENGRTLSLAGSIDFTADADGPVSNGVELVTRFAASQEVSQCFVTQLGRFMRGHQETTATACSDYRLNEAYRRSGGDMREVLVTMTQTDDFLYRRTAP